MQKIIGKFLRSLEGGKRKFESRDVTVDHTEIRAFLHVLLERRPSLVPLVVILKEFVKLLLDKAYYEKFMNPFESFLEQSRRVLTMLSIQRQEEYFPVIGYTLLKNGSPASIDPTKLHCLTPVGLSFAAVRIGK